MEFSKVAQRSLWDFIADQTPFYFSGLGIAKISPRTP
jgi:hypothetical protein